MREKTTKTVQRDGYTLVTKLVWGEGGVKKNKPVEITSAYTPRGTYMGDAKMAKFLCDKMNLTRIQLGKNSNVCCIGFSEAKQKWYGWSHRAICGFGIGDKLFEEDWSGATDDTKWTKHGSKTIADLDDAKQAAQNFAESVS